MNCVSWRILSFFTVPSTYFCPLCLQYELCFVLSLQHLQRRLLSIKSRSRVGELPHLPVRGDTAWRWPGTGARFPGSTWEHSGYRERHRRGGNDWTHRNLCGRGGHHQRQRTPVCGVVSSVLLFVFVLFVRFCCVWVFFVFVFLLLFFLGGICCYVLCVVMCCVLLYVVTFLLCFVVVVSRLPLSFGGGGCLWEWVRFSLIRIRVLSSCKNSIQRSPLRLLFD